MRMRGYLLRSLLLFSACLIASLVVFVGFTDKYGYTAYAALSDGRWMDTAESLQVFGNTFTVTYYNGSEYVDTTATYTGSTRQLQSNIGDLPQGLECLQYTAPVTNLTLNPSYITVRFYPQYSINDTSQIHTGLFVYAGISSASVPPYHSPQWEWTISGNRQVFTGPLVNNDSQLDVVRVGVDTCFYVNVDYSQQSTFSASSVSVTFIAPVGTDSGKVWFYIAPPYISSNATGSNGIVTGTTTTNQNQGGTDINVNVDVDMTETNGLLGDIIDVLDGIVDNIGGLFVPEQDVFDTFENDMADLLMETFGGVDSDMLINVIQDLLTHGATQSVTFPQLTVQGVQGSTFSIQARSVPLKPHATQGHDFYESVALAIDLICTCWVVNQIFDNIKKIIVGEKVVEVDVD